MVAPTLLYLLKANAVLVLFAAAYYGLLRRLTFFDLNRAYLLGALAFAVAYPLLPVPALLPATAALPVALARAAGPAAGGGAVPTPGFNWQAAGLGLYAAGAGLLLLRLLGQLLSLARVHRRSRPAVVLGQPVRVLPGAGGPFSFGGAIYLSEGALANPAALPPALRHEQAHVRQGHTLDVLLLQVAVALAWLNPASWLLRRAALDNLEYLADRAALRAGLDRRAYQYSLLHQPPGGVPGPALAFHFSFLTLKNRIAMLNQPLSSTRQLGRYFLAAPLVVLLTLGYAGARAQTAPAPVSKDAAYYLDGAPTTMETIEKLDPNLIATIDVVKDGEKLKKFFRTAKPGAMVITTKANTDAPAVVAMREGADLASNYDYVPAEVNALVPKALAYITSHYPDSRLGGRVLAVRKKGTTETLKYQVQLVTGKRPFEVLFSPEGDFLGQ